MRNLPGRLIRAGAVFLLSAVAFVASGGAHATCQLPPAWSASSTYNTGDVVAFDLMSSDGTLVSGAFYQSLVDGNMGNMPPSSPSQWNGNNILVCEFTVQPIDVCSSTGTNCPVINSLGQTAKSAPGTTLIGSIDPANPTGPSLDQAAFAHIGVAMAVNPVVLWNSPANPYSQTPLEPNYGWLHVCSCDAGSSTSCPSLNSCASGASSLDLLNITQQPQIALSTPDNPYTPTFPLNSLHTMNLHFVHVIHPLKGGSIIKGFSWQGNNGGAIASDSVFTSFSPGTAAHEGGHQLGPPNVDGHTQLGAGGGGGMVGCLAPYPDPNSECTENLMTAGGVPTGTFARELPNGLIDSASNNCGALPGQACWVPQVPPENTTPPSALALLTTGGVGLCDTTTISQCPSAQAAFLLSNLLDSIPNTVSTASQSGTATASTQAVSNTAPAARSGASSSGDPIVFDVSGLTRANPGETLLAYVVMIPQPPAGSPQFTFARKPFKVISESRRNLLQDFDMQPQDSDVPYPPCAGTGVLCGEVEFNRKHGQGFGANDFMRFSLAILKGGAPAGLGDLCGAKVAFIYSDGFTPTSVLGPCSGSSPPSILIATSLSQDPMTAPQVIAVPTPVVPNNTPACTPLPNGQCSNPVTEGVTDSNPATGLEGGALCYSNGIPIQCP
jgi:hypothetical protein